MAWAARSSYSQASESRTAEADGCMGVNCQANGSYETYGFGYRAFVDVEVLVVVVIVILVVRHGWCGNLSCEESAKDSEDWKCGSHMLRCCKSPRPMSLRVLRR